MMAKRVRAGLARVRGEGKRLGRARLPRYWKNESARPWRLLGGPVSASLPNSSESILGQCSGSAALSRPLFPAICLSRMSRPTPNAFKIAAVLRRR